MNSDSHEQLSLETLKRVDAVCATYEKAWTKEQPPRLEDFLEGIDEPERGLVFRELLKLDAELRGRAGLLPATEELRQRFPEYGELITALDTKNAAEAVTVPPLDSSPLAPGGRGVGGEGAASGSATTDGTQTSGIDDLPFLAAPTRPGAVGKLGHYDIEGVVGRGGMGVVLRAFDSKLNRIVAIKVLGPQFATNATARRRFEREAKAAAAVSHDHVVAIHHVDEIGGVPFLVMPLIVGQSLQDRLDESGPLELTAILRIGNQIAEGLAAAHKKALVHRDIKPANILLENGVERVKITDFGLARAVDDASVTQSGVVAGTPMFMAPEQAANETVDHRADLFSLGSVLYTMCTGRPPFRATGTIAVMMRVIEDTPRPIREINPDIPDWLCDIISKLHAKKPADRFQTAKEVAELLEQHLAHLQQPDVAPRPAAVVIARQTPPSPSSTLEMIFEGEDRRKRLQQFAVLVPATAAFLIGLFLTFRGGPSQVRWSGPELLILGLAGLVAAAWIKQRWEVRYRGHIIRFENSCYRGESLFIDGFRVDRGGFGSHRELRGVILEGESAGDTVLAMADAAVFRFRCRIFIEHHGRLDQSAPERASTSPARTTWRRLAWIGAGYVLSVCVLFVLIAAYSDGGWWSTPWIEMCAAGGFVLLAIWQFVRKTRPRWLPAVSVLLAIFFVALGHVVWPFSTARHFARLLREGRYEQANRMLKEPMRFELQGGFGPDQGDRFRRVGFITLHTGSHSIKFSADETLLMHSGDWGDFEQHLQNVGFDNWFPFGTSSNHKKRSGFLCRLDWLAHNGRIRLHSMEFHDLRIGAQNAMTLADWNALKDEEVAESGPDENRLQGTWVVVAGDMNGGQPLPTAMLKEMTLTFTGNKARITNPGGKTQEGTFTLYPDKNPKQITIREETPIQVSTMTGIYSFVGETLNMCMGSPEDPQPTRFASLAGTRIMNLVLKKAGAVVTPKLPETAAEVLAAMVGAWRVEITHRIIKGQPAKIVTQGHADIGWVAGRRWLRVREQVGPPGANFVQVFSYDPQTSDFRNFHFDATGVVAGPTTSRWDSRTHTLTGTSQPAEVGLMVKNTRFIDANTMEWEAIVRDKAGKTIFDTSAKLTRSPQPTKINEDEAPVPVPAEMAVLHKLVGDWQSEGMMKLPVQAPAKSKSATAKIMGGRYIATSFTDSSLSTLLPDAYRLSSYDEAAKLYRMWTFSGNGATGELSGTWDVKAQKMSWTWAEPNRARVNTWQQWRGPDRYEETTIVWDAADKVVTEVQSTTTRQTSGAGKGPLKIDPNDPENVLARMFGTWNIIQQRQIPTPATPEQARSSGVFVYEPVAGGKFWRGLGSFDTEKSNNQAVLVIRGYDQAAKEFKEWWFTSDGKNVGAGTGTWDAATQTFTWIGKPEPGVEATNGFKFLDADTIQGHQVRKQGGKIVWEARNTMNRVAQTLAPPEMPLDPKRPAVLRSLDALAGFWRNDVIMKRAPEPDRPFRLITDHHIRPILAGHLFEAHDDDSDLQSDRNYWLIGSAAGGKHYRFWHFNVGGGHIVSNGAWDEMQKKIRWIATDGSIDASWTMKSPSERAVEFGANDPQGKFLFHAKGNSRRLQTPTLKSFKPEHQLLTTDGVTPDQGGWRIDSKGKGIVRLFELQYPGVDDCTIVFKAKLKTQKMEVGASLEMWARLVDQESFSKGEGQHQVAGTTNWSEYEIPFFLKKSQLVNRLQLGLRLGGAGTVWIKDIVLERR